MAGCLSYALRQLSNVPDSSWVKEVTYGFTADSTTVTCTQNTTNGASVSTTIFGVGSATLNQAGSSYSASVEKEKMTMVSVWLATPDSYNTYTGYGTVVN